MFFIGKAVWMTGGGALPYLFTLLTLEKAVLSQDLEKIFKKCLKTTGADVKRLSLLAVYGGSMDSLLLFRLL